MNKRLYLVVAMSVLAATTTPVYADIPAQNSTEVTIDINKLDDQTKLAVLNQIKKDSTPAVAAITPDKAKGWADTGKSIGEAIAASAKALNTGVNDFIKTPAGILTVWAILAYLFGGTILHIVFGPLIWAVVCFCLWRSMNAFCRPWKKTYKDGTILDKTYQWPTNDSRMTCLWMHLIAMGVMTFIMIIAVFTA